MLVYMASEGRVCVWMSQEIELPLWERSNVNDDTSNEKKKNEKKKPWKVTLT